MSDPHDPTRKPRPGLGRRSPDDPHRPRPTAVAGTSVEEPLDSSLRQVLGIGLNPLARAATPALVLAANLRETVTQRDVGALRRQLRDELARFNEEILDAGVKPEIARLAHYALCATLDEAVLSTPWGAQSDWSRPTMLAELHGDAFGGEKFFDMLERISLEPQRYIDLLELQYLCLAVGFAGRLDTSHRGGRPAKELADVRHETYQHIRAVRDAAPRELSLRWRGLEDRRNPVVKYVPWWVVAAAALAVVAVTYAILAERLRRVTEPIQAAIATLDNATVVDAAPAAPVTGPTLRQLLAQEEARGELEIIEQPGGRTIVTPRGDTMFASGSARVESEYEGLLRRVGVAVDRLPGRVLVVGHTDDQPVRGRYSTNVELSRERAVSVMRILQLSLADPSRVLPSGLGSSQPKYPPENRAGNRRVEIVHVRGS